MKPLSYFLLFVSLGLFAQEPLSERTASYDIDVTLDPSEKKLWGSQKLHWVNNSSDLIDTVQFHMYMNAFKDEYSTFMKETGGRHRNNRLDKEKLNYGNIYITSLKTDRGENLLKGINFIQPDDFNKKDQTVFELALEEPLQAGDSITFEIDFRVKLPQIFARTGFAQGEYFLVAQWFPKIGVYEAAGTRYAREGKWNCHQFHGNTEFYADFGVYNVNITLPSRFVVGSTGSLLKTEAVSDTLKKLYYRAEDVHDFAWTAAPDFVEVKDRWKGVELIALMQPSHKHQVDRYFTSVKRALEYYDKHLGTYPFPTLTMVDPPLNASGSGGMEYPRFITCGYTSWLMPDNIRLQEVVTIHEFGHQYFQGMLASNEFEESWLDEGFNTYYEWRIMEEYYPKGQVSFLGFEFPGVGTGRDSYVGMQNPEITEVFRNAWEYPKGTFGTMSYSKTGLWMTTLENLVGRAAMTRAMKAYFQKYKFKHPSGENFTDVFNATVEPIEGRENYDWFFDQALYKSYSCDYKVDSISYEGSEVGYEVFISREGNFVFPQTVHLTYADGSTESLTWDGLASTHRISRSKPLVSVHLDKGRRNLMDLNLINNSYTLSGDKAFYWKYAAKLTFWVQRVFELFATWA